MLDLVPEQIATLERFSRAGFKLVSLAHVERYLGVEKDGFVALLEPVEGKLRVFGQVGLRMGEGIGMLVERRAGKAFVWKQESIAATPALLEGYEHFRDEVRALLETGSQLKEEG